MRRRLLLLFLLALLALAADGAYVAFRLAGDLRTAADELRSGLDALRAAEFDAAGTHLGEALAKAEGASGLQGHPAYAVGTWLPGIGNDLDAVSALADAATEGSHAGLLAVQAARVIGGADEQIAERVFPEGQVKFDLVHEVEPLVDQAATRLETAERILQEAPRPSLGIVRDALAEATAEVEDAAGTAANGRVLFGALPGLLAEDGARRYLLAFQSPSEARATGGLIGLYGVLEARDGRMDLREIGYIADFVETPFPAADAPEWFERHYGPLSATREWQQANLSPHFPVVSRVLLQIFEEVRGEALDGVVAMDPIAFGNFLKATGPITNEKTGITVGPDNVADVLLRDSYLDFETAGGQNRFLGDLVDDFWMRLRDGRVDAPVLAQELARSVGSAHFKMYSIHEEDQAALHELDASGEYDDEGPNVQLMFHNNYVASKVDYFLQRRQETTVRFTESGEARIEVDVTLRNDAPDGPPSPLLGSPDFKGYPAGMNGLYINFLLPPEAEVHRFLENGEQAPYLLHRDGAFPVAWDLVELDPGETRTVTLRYHVEGMLRGAGPDRTVFDMTLLPQAVVRPDDYVLRVVPPPGLRFDTGSPSSFVTQGKLDSEVRVSLEMVPE